MCSLTDYPISFFNSMDRDQGGCNFGDLAPGFRFFPTEEELLSFYLHNMLEGKRQDLDQAMKRVIPVLDIYEHNPWELPQFSGELCNGDPEQWFFFIPMQESEARGGRPRRLTDIGYWKGTGSPGYVYSSNNRIIGVKRSMVFYIGRAPHGNKTEWKLNDYKAIQCEASSSRKRLKLRHEFSLCRVYKKSKFLSSFDRRPMGDIQSRKSRDHQIIDLEEEEEDEATTSNQVPPRMEDGISSPSQELSFTNNNINNQEQSFQFGSLVDEPIWDWEQLENLYQVGEYM